MVGSESDRRKNCGIKPVKIRIYFLVYKGRRNFVHKGITLTLWSVQYTRDRASFTGVMLVDIHAILQGDFLLGNRTYIPSIPKYSTDFALPAPDFLNVNTSDLIIT